jgi:hypothetical protein
MLGKIPAPENSWGVSTLNVYYSAYSQFLRMVFPHYVQRLLPSNSSYSSAITYSHTVTIKLATVNGCISSETGHLEFNSTTRLLLLLEHLL